MHFTSALLLIAAVGSVSAHPGHRHAHLHEKKAVADSLAEVGAPLEARGSGRWIKNKKPKSSPVPQAPASSSPAPAPAAPSSSTPSSGNGAFVPFCDGQSSTSKRATLYDIGYIGNTGVPGKFGCNIQKIDCAAITKYDYSATFSTTGGGQTYSCSTFNKIGPTGEVNGFWTSIFDFDVKDGETVCLAFDANTQGGVGCGPGTGSAPRTPLGQIAGMWAEFDFGSKKNLHHVTGAPQSGADVSALVAIDYKLPYIGMAITDPTGKLCSWAKSDGRNFAAYMDGMHAADGVGCKDYEKGTVKVVLGD